MNLFFVINGKITNLIFLNSSTKKIKSKVNVVIINKAVLSPDIITKINERNKITRTKIEFSNLKFKKYNDNNNGKNLEI